MEVERYLSDFDNWKKTRDIAKKGKKPFEVEEPAVALQTSDASESATTESATTESEKSAEMFSSEYEEEQAAPIRATTAPPIRATTAPPIRAKPPAPVNDALAEKLLQNFQRKNDSVQSTPQPETLQYTYGRLFGKVAVAGKSWW